MGRVVVSGNRDIGRGVPVQRQNVELAARREDLGLQVGHGPGIADQQAVRMRGIDCAGFGREAASLELLGLKRRQILHERVAAGQRRLGLQHTATGVERLEIAGDILQRLDDPANAHVCFGKVDLTLQVRNGREADVVVVRHDVVRAKGGGALALVEQARVVALLLLDLGVVGQ